MASVKYFSTCCALMAPGTRVPSAKMAVGVPVMRCFLPNSTFLASADASRLNRIQSVLVSGQALCLMASTTINPAVYIQSGKYLYRIGSITP